MKELDPVILLAVFQEMLGFWLWVLLAVLAVGALAFLGLLAKEKRLVSARMMRSQGLGLLGGVLALVIMAKVSSSGFTDAGGPADWFLIALVFGIGLVCSTLLFYTLGGWWPSRRR